MPFLNYHHLRYFRLIARELSLVRAAKKLNLSAPALSIQLKQLEESLGHRLLERRRGGLVLTEAGRLALDYAETIGRAGEELMDLMQHRPRGGRQVLRVGAVATLSRNFQLEFLRPALHRPEVEVVVRSGGLRELLMMLHALQVDLVLSNQPARRDAETAWHSHLLAEQPVSLVGAPEWRKKRLRFPEGLADVPVILPSLESNMRAGFDRLLAAAGVRPRIVAEVDDMAMIRLLAREGGALALVPPVVVRGEIEAGCWWKPTAFPRSARPSTRSRRAGGFRTRWWPNWCARLPGGMTDHEPRRRRRGMARKKSSGECRRCVQSGTRLALRITFPVTSRHVHLRKPVT